MTNQMPDESAKETVGSSLVEFLTVLVKYRKFLIIFIGSITIIATAYALLAPRWYLSTAVVLPAEQTDLLGGISGLSSLVKGFSASKGLAGLTGSDETDRYIAILQSATVVNDVIKKFDLRNNYDMQDDYYENVVKELESNINFEVGDEGQLLIDVYDKHPQRAADMANHFVDLLNEINSNLHVLNAKANREFIEKRYEKNLDDIILLEDSLESFQKEYGVVSVPEQLKTTVEAMAGIYGQLAEKEIEVEVLNKTYGKSHPLTSLSQTELDVLKDKINAINSGANINSDEINLLIPFKKAPEMAKSYLKIYRGLEIQYKILEFVTPLYEQAKVEEVRNTPSVLVLDRAGPAERKAKPRGSLYALLSFVISLSLGLFAVFTMEMVYRIRERDPQKYEYLFGWIQQGFKLPIRKN